MKRLAVIGLCMLATGAYAQQKAVTESGEIVILNSDGTWQSVKEQGAVDKITTNAASFKKPDAATFLLKSTKNKSAFWLDASKWTFSKGKSGDASEYAFSLKAGDLYGMAITEEIEMPIESLAALALENAKQVSPDMKVAKKEYRVVNGTKAIYMEMAGAVQGVRLRFLGYYTTDPAGSTQYVVYTSENLVEKYRADIDGLLNGLGNQ